MKKNSRLSRTSNDHIEAHMKAFFDHPAGLHIITGPNGTIERVNTSWKKHLGYTPQELEGRNVLELIHPDDLESTRKALEQQTQGEAVSQFENRYRHKDGSWHPLMWWSSMLEEDGRIYAIAHDMTEQKRAQEELLREQHLLEKSQELGHIGTWELDIEKNELIWTDEARRIFGSPEGSVTHYEHFLDAVHPDDRDYVNREWSAAIEGKPYDIEHRILRNGSILWIREKAEIEPDDTGKAIRAIGFTQDITEHKQAENALKESEKELHNLAESMPQIVWTTRADGWNIYFNQQWVNYTGLTLEESYGHGWNTPFHPDDRQRAWDAWKNAVENRADYSLECRLRRFDGTYRWWLIRGVPQFNEAGEIVKWYGTCTDIEQVKQAEDALRKSEVLLNETAMTVKVGGWEIDLSKETLAWTDETFHIHELDRTEQPTVKESINYYHSDDRCRVENAVQTTIETGEPFDFEARLITKRGNLKWVQAKGNTVFVNGEAKAVRGIVQDITARKQMEEELANHRANLEEQVEERTRELRTIVNAMAGREVRMAELKETITALRRQLLDAGIEPAGEDPDSGEEGSA